MRDNPIHLAIIMDGNGRWAQRRGVPRSAGHRQGAKAVDAVVRAAAEPHSGIRWLTLYAFSSDNWSRPEPEVRALMRLFAEYLRKEVPRCVENGIRLEVVGRRDRLSPRLVRRIEAATAATAGGERLTLRLAIDYSARDVIARAAERAFRGSGGGPSTEVREGSCEGPCEEPARVASNGLGRESFRRLLAAAEGSDGAAPDVDLLIRTGGEQRLSDFLLWECAYAELYFTPVPWPEFGPSDLAAALAEYGRRTRKFGRVLEEAV